MENCSTVCLRARLGSRLPFTDIMLRLKEPGHYDSKERLRVTETGLFPVSTLGHPEVLLLQNVYNDDWVKMASITARVRPAKIEG